MAQNIDLNYSNFVGTFETITKMLAFLRSGSVGNVSMVGCTFTFLDKPITDKQLAVAIKTTPRKPT